ncbi:MAG: hypothetical protein QM813_19750 [Verrucomicrobiota bacterium]
MESRVRRSGNHSQTKNDRIKVVLLCLGIILVLALVAGFMWLISSPESLRRE